MAIAIHFDKAKAERFIECLTQGRPIDGARSVDEILTLAGACFYMAMSQAPELYKAVDWERLGRRPEDDIEDEDSFFAELHAAIEYYGQLAMLVASGEYDQSFDREHSAIVTVEDGDKTVIPVAGMKEEPEESASE